MTNFKKRHSLWQSLNAEKNTVDLIKYSTLSYIVI